MNSKLTVLDHPVSFSKVVNTNEAGTRPSLAPKSRATAIIRGANNCHQVDTCVMQLRKRGPNELHIP